MYSNNSFLRKRSTPKENSGLLWQVRPVSIKPNRQEKRVDWTTKQCPWLPMPAGEHAVHQWVRSVRYDWIIPCSATQEGVVHSQLVSFQPCFFSCCQPVGGFTETLLYAYSVYTHDHICSSQTWKIQTSTSILNKRPIWSYPLSGRRLFGDLLALFFYFIQFLLRVIWFLALCLGNVTTENLVTIAESKEVAALKIGPVTRLVPRIRKSGKFFACGNQNPGLKRSPASRLRLEPGIWGRFQKVRTGRPDHSPTSHFDNEKSFFPSVFEAISFIHAI